jgi:hypothetical protein
VKQPTPGVPHFVETFIDYAKDDVGFGVLIEIIQLGKSDKEYKHLLPELAKACRENPRVMGVVRGIMGGKNGAR